MKAVLTVKDVADFLGVSKVTVRRWCHSGLLPAVKANQRWLITRSDLMKVVRPPSVDKR